MDVGGKGGSALGLGVPSDAGHVQAKPEGYAERDIKGDVAWAHST